MKFSKERLLYWVKTKINIVNIKEGVIPSDEETQAYRQICQIIELHFSDDWQLVKKELGNFMQKQKSMENKIRIIRETEVKKEMKKGTVCLYYSHELGGAFVPEVARKKILKGAEFCFFTDELDEEKPHKKGKCEHDWFDITVHDEKYGKTYRCSKCPKEKFVPHSKELTRKLGITKKDLEWQQKKKT